VLASSTGDIPSPNEKKLRNWIALPLSAGP
jgi:hypothetical protein